MNLIAKLKARFTPKKEQTLTARHGQIGEAAAKKLLQKSGLKYLTANFKSARGEIDLVFRDEDCLVFVEVKARKIGGWMRPSRYVNKRKKQLLTRCAFDYLRLLDSPQIKIRFDVVEVLLEDGVVHEIRHLPNTFNLAAPYRYG